MESSLLENRERLYRLSFEDDNSKFFRISRESDFRGPYPKNRNMGTVKSRKKKEEKKH